MGVASTARCTAFSASALASMRWPRPAARITGSSLRVSRAGTSCCWLRTNSSGSTTQPMSAVASNSKLSIRLGRGTFSWKEWESVSTSYTVT